MCLKPLKTVNHFTEITPEWLQKNKVKFILADLDGTLAPHNEDLDDHFKNWYDSIEKVGVGVIIVSNNSEERVNPILKKYHLFGISRAGKPSIKKIEKEIIVRGLNIETSLFIGDQLFTDLWVAKRLHMKSIWVKKIPGKEPWFEIPKRVVEKIYWKRWSK